MGWFQVAWIILGSLGAVGCVGMSIVSFADSKPGQGVLYLLAVPLAFVVAVFAVMLALLAGIAWLIMAALSY